jgi:hypothetical protein
MPELESTEDFDVLLFENEAEQPVASGSGLGSSSNPVTIKREDDEASESETEREDVPDTGARSV